jgi:hypothetical protein
MLLNTVEAAPNTVFASLVALFRAAAAVLLRVFSPLLTHM